MAQLDAGGEAAPNGKTARSTPQPAPYEESSTLVGGAITLPKLTPIPRRTVPQGFFPTPSTRRYGHVHVQHAMADTGFLQSLANAAALARQLQTQGTGEGGETNSEHADDGTLTRVAGIVYAVGIEEARQKEWKTYGMRPGGRSGKFVEVEDFFFGEHRFLTIKDLGTCFKKANTEEMAFPDLDRILAKAYPNAETFVANWEATGWAVNEEALGALATATQAEFAVPLTVQSWIGMTTMEKAVDRLRILLEKAIEGEEGILGGTMWLGSPALPVQLLATLQRKVASKTPQWVPPVGDRTVELLGEISRAGVDARVISQAVALGLMVDWNKADDVSARLGRAKATANLIREGNGWTWKELCTAAGHEGVESRMMELNEFRAGQAAARNTEKGHGRLDAAKGDQRTSIVVTTPREDAPKLTDAETEELEEILRRGASNEIDVAKCKLLTEMVGTGISHFQPGGRDLGPLAMSQVAKNFVHRIREELYGVNSLRCVPEIALVKLLALRFGDSDMFIYELFGHIAYRDSSEDPPLHMTVKGVSRDIQVVRARKDVWMNVRSMADLDTVIHGMAQAAKRMLHPTVLSHRELEEFGDMLRHAYEEWGGCTLVTGLFSTLKARLAEHAATMRSIALGQRTEDALPLTTLGQRSKATLERAVLGARNACLYKLGTGSSEGGETNAGRALKVATGTDASGKRSAYKRFQQTPTKPPKKLTKVENAKPIHRVQVPCLRCGEHGHRMKDCGNDFCPIDPAWPPKLIEVAKSERIQHGVAPVLAPAHG